MRENVKLFLSKFIEKRRIERASQPSRGEEDAEQSAPNFLDELYDANDNARLRGLFAQRPRRTNSRAHTVRTGYSVRCQ